MRKRLARWVLVLGAVTLVLYLGPRWPREQELVFELGPSRGDLTRLEASWSKEGDPEVGGGMTWDFQGPPPESVRRTLSLPNGQYMITVELTYKGSGNTRPKTSWARRVILGGTRTTLQLGDNHP